MKQSLHPKVLCIFFFQSIFRLIFGGFIVFIWVASIFFDLYRNLNYIANYLFVLYILLLFIFCFIFSYLWARLSYRFWKYEITEDAVRIEKGVIWKKYISIPYERIQNVDIYRGILARILGLSTLNIQTAGYSGAGGRGMWSEGNIPGVSVDIAEQLRNDLIKRAKGTRQGL